MTDIITDSMIVDLYFDRNELAITESDKKYGVPLRTFAKRMLSDDGSSEECLNDTYMKSWDSIPPSEPRDYLFAFLAKILRHKCLDRIKMKGRMKRSSAVTVISEELASSSADAQHADDGVLREELAQIIRTFVEGLPEEKREIFVLRYFYMENIARIAFRLSISEGKVKTVLKRLRDKLKEHLEFYGYTV